MALVSIARALFANPKLLQHFRDGQDEPVNRCSHCNRCIGRRPTSPLGCYDARRFASRKKMVDQIMCWNRADPVDQSVEERRDPEPNDPRPCAGGT
jgi:hypothetical protein